MKANNRNHNHNNENENEFQPQQQQQTIRGGSVSTGEEPPPHSGELNHALSQVGGPTQSQVSRLMSSGHHIYNLYIRYCEINFTRAGLGFDGLGVSVIVPRVERWRRRLASPSRSSPLTGFCSVWWSRSSRPGSSRARQGSTAFRGAGLRETWIIAKRPASFLRKFGVGRGSWTNCLRSSHLETWTVFLRGPCSGRRSLRLFRAVCRMLLEACVPGSGGRRPRSILEATEEFHTFSKSR